LQDVKDCQGRLTDSAGQPIAGAKIRPTTWSCDWNREEQVQYIVFLPARLAKQWTTETGADGRFTIHNVPTTGSLSTKLSADGFGEPRVGWKLDRPATLQLGRVGRIQGTVVCRHDPKAVAEIKLKLETDFSSQPREDGSYVRYSSEGAANRDGSFQFENVPPGKYIVLPKLSVTPPCYSQDGGPIEVKSSEIARVSVAVRPALKLQGKVVDQETGAGVPEVHVMLYFNDPRGRGDDGKSATTDAKGEFTLYSRPGKGFLQLWPIPDPYINPSRQQSVEVKDDAMLEPIRLERAKGLEGIVVDKSGKPVAGAKICCTSLSMDDSFYPDRDIHTDRNGKFLLKRVTSKSRLNVRARTDRAAAEPVNVAVGESKGPLRLVLDEATSCKLQGAIVDDDGQPVPKAKIQLILNLWFGNHGTSFACETAVADAAGKFQIGGLWGGDKYEVHASADKHETRGTRSVEGTVGGAIDFGKIVLLSTGGVVSGKVTDSAGKPLANVRVFNSGDAPEPIETRSDTAGTFSLKGLHKGPVYVSAEKNGYRFTGLKTNSGAGDAVLKLLRPDEPPPKWSPPPVATNEDEQKEKAARRVLELLSTANDQYVKRRALEQRAALEFKRAKKDKKQPTATNANAPAQPKKGDIYNVAEEDVEDALSMLPQNQGQAYRQLKDLAEHFAASDREKALRFTAEAIVRARGLDDPERVQALAELGALASRLGNKEGGAKLVREAADMAAKWVLNEQREWQMTALAKTIAKVDLPAALDMAKKINKNRRGSCLADIAMGLDDISKAESVLDGIDGWYAGRARGRLAFRIAAAKPAEAVRLVEGIPLDSGREDLTRAAAFGWLATAIAAKDPKLAHSLIDRAFAIELHPKDPTQYLAGERAALPALLAVHARMSGYTDMESVICRVLATRVTMKNTWSPVAVQESAVASALFLALVDRPLAKEMLQAVEPNSDALGSGCCGIGIRDWLKAWALVDPLRAAEMVERQLAAAKDENAKRLMWYTSQQMIELWSGNLNDVVKCLSRDYGNVFSPYER
jgi:protocatechuate 3,4-dioxygenase beta subunit